MGGSTQSMGGGGGGLGDAGRSPRRVRRFVVISFRIAVSYCVRSVGVILATGKKRTRVKRLVVVKFHIAVFV